MVNFRITVYKEAVKDSEVMIRVTCEERYKDLAFEADMGIADSIKKVLKLMNCKESDELAKKLAKQALLDFTEDRVLQVYKQRGSIVRSNGEQVILLDKPYDLNGVSTGYADGDKFFNNTLVQCASRERVEADLDTLTNTVKVGITTPSAWIALAAAFTGIYREVTGTVADSGIIINIAGKSGKGKTSLVRFIASMFESRDINSCMLNGQVGNTELGITRKITQLRLSPLVIDEILGKKARKAKAEAQDIRGLIFTLDGETMSHRGGIKILRDLNGMKNLVPKFLTSEVAFSHILGAIDDKLGHMRRYLELSDKTGNIFESGERVEVIEQQSDFDNTVLVEEFIKELLASQHEKVELNKLIKDLNSDEACRKNRNAKRAAVILRCYVLLCQVLGIKEQTEDMKQFILDCYEIARQNVFAGNKRVSIDFEDCIERITPVIKDIKGVKIALVADMKAILGVEYSTFCDCMTSGKYTVQFGELDAIVKTIDGKSQRVHTIVRGGGADV